MRNQPQEGNRFLWGVATSGYQAEGGYNTPGGPQNNWTWAEADEMVTRSGRAADFWNQAEEDLARCVALGLNAIRFGIEWSRVQPCTQIPVDRHPRRIEAPSFDRKALQRYADLLLECQRLDLEPLVTLHHFVHPAWLGLDPWLTREIFPHFERYVEETVMFLCDALSAKGGESPRWYLTVNEPNMLAFNHYAWRFFPSGDPRGLGATSICLAHLLEAHARAYRIVHRIYRERGLPPPMVSFNNYCSDLYWGDQAWVDLLVIGGRSASRRDLMETMRGQASAFERSFREEGLEIHSGFRLLMDRLSKRLHHPFGEKMFLHPAFDPLLGLLQEQESPWVDYLAYDYYDPFIAHIFRMPYSRDLDPRRRDWRDWILESMTSKWWDWRAIPEGMRFFSRWMARHALPQLIAENGMAYRLDNGSGRLWRRDGMRRVDFLEDHVEMVGEIRREGIDLRGYFYWSLFDNYEWGTFAPRFGLYGIDFSASEAERLEVNVFGENAPRVYAKLIRRKS